MADVRVDVRIAVVATRLCLETAEAEGAVMRTAESESGEGGAGPGKASGERQGVEGVTNCQNRSCLTIRGPNAARDTNMKGRLLAALNLMEAMPTP